MKPDRRSLAFIERGILDGTITVTNERKASGPGRWTLTIIGWHPVSDNKLSGCHWRVKHALKLGDARRVADEAALAKIPRATVKRRVSVRLLVPNMAHAPDASNTNKSLRDALVACGLLVNDDATWAEFLEPTVEKGKRATIISLADIGA